MKIRRITPSAIAVVAAVSLSACSSKDNASGVETNAPSTTSSAAASSSGTPSTSKSPATEKDKIVQAYRSYYATVSKTGQKKTSDVNAAISVVATGPALAYQNKFIPWHQSQGHLGYGKIVLHPVVSSIEDHGNRAIIQDCQDTSHSGWRNVKKQPVVSGYAQDSARTTLVKVDGVWKVYTEAAVEPANEYCS